MDHGGRRPRARDDLRSTACRQLARRSLVTLVAALVAAAAVVGAPSTTPEVGAAGERDLLVGDSVMAGMTADARSGLDPHLFDARVCRRLLSTSCSYRGARPSTAIDVVRGLADSVDRSIVVAAGYNDGSVGDAVDAVVAEARAAGVPHVVWLTYRTGAHDSGTYARHNATLRAKTAEHPELVLADWDAHSAGRGDWMAADGLHLNGRGALAMADLIASTLAGLEPIRCTEAAAGDPDPPTSSIRRSRAPRYVVIGDGPVRIADTRTTPDGMLRAGHHLRVPVAAASVPSDASAVLATVTVVDPCDAGYLTVFACGSSLPPTSTVNATRAGAIANLTIAPVVDGEVCVSSSVTTDVVIDVVGHLATSGSSLRTVTPRRSVDTRPGVPDELSVADGALDAGEVMRVPIVDSDGVTGDDGAVVVNVAVADPSDAGYLSVFPGPCDRRPPNTSNLNHVAGETIAAAAVSRIGSDGSICVFSAARAHVLVDLAAVIGPTGGRVQAVQGVRMADTRPSPPATTQELPARPASFGAPLGTTGVIVNVVAVGGRDGFVTVRPCGPTGWPGHSSVNHRDRAIANVAVAPLGIGAVCVFREVPTHLVVDALAWLVP